MTKPHYQEIADEMLKMQLERAEAEAQDHANHMPCQIDHGDRYKRIWEDFNSDDSRVIRLGYALLVLAAVALVAVVVL